MARRNLLAPSAPGQLPRPRQLLLYLRVSTDRQARNELSLSDQMNQLQARCEREGWQVRGVYRDEGVSGTTTKRPAFEAMITRATDGTRSVDAILVFAFSRAFRNGIDQELTVQNLRKHRVEVISHAEPLAEDATGDILRKFIGVVNEYQSREISRNTTRTMKENARRGYSNGGQIPYGYRSVEAEILGAKQKKRLDEEPTEAGVVRLCFDLALEGDGTSGPLGTKRIACWLNERGYRSRQGNLFGIGTIHEILTRKAYTGEREFNAFDRGAKTRKPSDEIVAYAVPQIVAPERFEAVQALLVARQPRMRGPRLDAAPSLLGGLIRCDCACSHALTTATGTSRRGKVYTYYKCIQATKQGRHHENSGAACTNRRIPRPLAEERVVEALLDRLLTAERLMEILTQVKVRRDGRQESAERRLATLATELAEAELRLGRIYTAIELGTLDVTDPTLKGRIAALGAERDRLREALDYARATRAEPVAIDPGAVERFTHLVRERLRSGDVAARKAYIAAIVDSVIVTEDTLRIVGFNDNLAAAVASKPKKVRNSVQEWCRKRDSNPRPPHYE